MEKRSHRKIQKRPVLTADEAELAQFIVKEELGDKFTLGLVTLPKNVGLKGDEGILGYTALITGQLERPAKFVIEEQELLTHLVGRLTNEVDPITRVIFDVTQSKRQTEKLDINTDYL